MAKGGSGGKNISVVGGGGGISAPNKTILNQAKANIKGVSGYDITTSNGSNTQFFFTKDSDGNTLYGNSINHIDQPTPNNWNESQTINAIKNNGGSVDKYTKNQLLDIEVKRLQDREATDRTLNNAYARNKVADIGSKQYRNTRKAIRRQKRR